MEEDRRKIFQKLDKLKLKAGEELKESYFKAGGKEPLFVITERSDGTFVLYSVNGEVLTRVQTATKRQALVDYVVPQLK